LQLTARREATDLRVYPDATSRWGGKRLWVSQDEIERAMDQVRVRAGNGTFSEGRGIDVERILERVYGVAPDFRDLDDGVLGKTAFLDNGELRVTISRGLAERAESSVSANHLLRSTIAHEIAHIEFHSEILRGDWLPPSADAARPAVLCRHSSITGGARGASTRNCWSEIQANMGMASLLLPAKFVHPLVDEFLLQIGCFSIRGMLVRSIANLVAEEISRVFDTSRQMTLFRLERLGALPGGACGQLLRRESRRYTR
jgi:hypothetical protein